MREKSWCPYFKRFNADFVIYYLLLSSRVDPLKPIPYGLYRICCWLVFFNGPSVLSRALNDREKVLK